MGRYDQWDRNNQRVNGSGVMQPGIDISSYATPVAANKDLVAVAVLYLTKGEAEAVKAFADEVKRCRGRAGVQSATVAWGTRVTTTDAVPPEEAFGRSSASGGGTNSRSRMVEMGEDLLPGWSRFNNVAAGRIEYVSPSNKRHVRGGSGKLVEVMPTCNRGHSLPDGDTWCSVCDERVLDLLPEPKKPEPEPKKPEPERPRDRFEGLEL